MMVHKALSIQVEAAWEAGVRRFHIIHGLKIMVDSIWEYSAWIKYLEAVGPVSPTLALLSSRCIVYFFRPEIVKVLFTT